MQKIFSTYQEIRKAIATRDGIKRLIFHSALALTFTAGLSYVAGFVRDRLLAQTFGASSALDVYYAAFVVPDLILALFVTSSVSAAFVPLFIEAKKRSQRDARNYFYNILTLLSVGIIGIVIMAFIFLPYVTEFLVPGFSADQKETYITVVRILLLSPLIFALSNIFGGVLLSLRDFFFYGIAPVFYNLGIIAGIFFLVPQMGMIGLVWGTVFGAALHFFSRAGLTIVRVGFPTRLPFYWNKRTTKTVLLMLPKILQIGAWQILLGWFIHIASKMEEGSVTAYSLARNFQSMPVSLIGIAIALSAFTALSHFAAKHDFVGFHKILMRKLITVFLLTTSIALLMAFCATLIIQTLLGGGAFDAASVSLTALVLTFYTLSIPLESMMHLLARAHYALQKTLVPSMIHIFSISLTVIIGWVTYEAYGIIVIPLSFFAGLFVQNILLYFSYRKLIIKQCV